MPQESSSTAGRPDSPHGAALVLPLRSAHCAAVDAVGGKAVNLHRMVVAGLPVPDGFCVTTQAYRLAVQPLADDLEATFDGARTLAEGRGDLASVAGRIRGLVGSSDIPADVRDSIVRAYRDFARAEGVDVPAVAVRSSATAEDLADASFAGQQDSYLNVVGEESLVEAVRACWASLWTDRAVAYRADQGIDPADVALAVVVQRMVDARAAGVLFTADPVTGSRSRTVIDANEGLGESVVSGEVNPDRYVVDRAAVARAVNGGSAGGGSGSAVVSRELGDKLVTVRARPGGGVTREYREYPEPQLDAAGSPADLSGDSSGARASAADEGVLTDAQLIELTALAARASDLFGAPQDVEWALDESGRFWLTQARPVTTLYPLVHFVTDARSTHRPPDRPGPRIFLCASLAQGLTRPVTPLGRGAIRLLTAAGARLAGVDVPDPRLGAPFYAEGGERIFGDVTTAFRNPLGRRLVGFAFAYMEARSATALAHLDADPAFAPIDAAGGSGRTATASGWAPVRRVQLIASTLGAIARFWVATGIPPKALLAVRDPDLAVRRVEEEIERLRHCLDLPAQASPMQRLDAVERLLCSPQGMVMPAIAGYAIPGFLALGVAGRLLRGRIGPGELQAVLRGLPHNVTTQMDLELWDLSRELDSQAPDPERLSGFLERWGDRAVAEIDLGMPRWREQPEHLVGTLRNYGLVTDETTGPRAVFERGRLEGEAAVERLLDRAGGPVRRAVVGFALDRARRLVGLREAPKLGLVTVLARAREQFQHIGADLLDAGLLDAVDDVFFLDLFALREGVEHLRDRSATGAAAAPSLSDAVGADLRAVVAANRTAYERELRRRHIPRLVLSDGTEVEALAPPGHAPQEPGVLTGTPASTGVVTGVARVVTDPTGAHLAPGEILIAPSTDPGWTPLFLTAGGLVMEMGGSNSHGAVVAREYGIPAVVGVDRAASRIRTGQRVVVDGAAGTVRIVEGVVEDEG